MDVDSGCGTRLVSRRSSFYLFLLSFTSGVSLFRSLKEVKLYLCSPRQNRLNKLRLVKKSPTDTGLERAQTPEKLHKFFERCILSFKLPLFSFHWRKNQLHATREVSKSCMTSVE